MRMPVGPVCGRATPADNSTCSRDVGMVVVGDETGVVTLGDEIVVKLSGGGGGGGGGGAFAECEAGLSG